MAGGTHRAFACVGAGFALCLGGGAALAQTTPPLDDLRELSIEQLSNLEIVTASRRPEVLSGTPAAIDVITSEDIERSGAQSLPEILRLARNLEVARVSSQNYSISARGFNSFQASNKILALLDGRSLYTPLYSGVLWDQQITFLEDIDRIEVVSGPGGTVWGANAVNGVINVITKSSADTQGALARAFVGTADQRLDARYGGRISEGATYRVYGTLFERGTMLSSTGAELGNDWEAGQVGFRTDWGGVEDRFMVEGALHDRLDSAGDNNGGHLLGRWNHLMRNGSNVEAQAFYSRAAAGNPGVSDELQIWDVELKHSLQNGPHQIVWGGGYRISESVFQTFNNPSSLVEPDRTLRTGNVFVQDEIALRDNLGLTLGLKIEDHTYTEIEYMPNVRLAWQPGRHSLIWAAVSRAVRTPSRIDRELVNPGVVIPGEFRSEDLLAYEIGYRGQPASNWAVAANLYHHEYDNVRTLNFTPPGVLPVQYGNGLSGHVQGLELWSDVDVTADWRLSAGLTLLDQEFTADPLTIDFNGTGFDPEYQVFVRSYIDIANTFDLNLFLRAIDEVHPQVPAYVELDATLGWRFGDFDLALVGRNLLDESHPESFNGQTPQEARRSLQLSATITY